MELQLFRLWNISASEEIGELVSRRAEISRNYGAFRCEILN
jgi:hypothetical protein